MSHTVHIVDFLTQIRIVSYFSLTSKKKEKQTAIMVEKPLLINHQILAELLSSDYFRGFKPYQFIRRQRSQEVQLQWLCGWISTSVSLERRQGGVERTDRNKKGRGCRVNKASWEISPVISTSHFHVFSSESRFNKLRIKTSLRGWSSS